MTLQMEREMHEMEQRPFKKSTVSLCVPQMFVNRNTQEKNWHANSFALIFLIVHVPVQAPANANHHLFCKLKPNKASPVPPSLFVQE